MASWRFEGEVLCNAAWDVAVLRRKKTFDCAKRLCFSLRCPARLSSFIFFSFWFFCFGFWITGIRLFDRFLDFWRITIRGRLL